MTLTSIECRFMNESLTLMSWYSGPTGLPEEVDCALSSSGRMINRSGSEGLAPGRIRGSVDLARRRDR